MNTNTKQNFFNVRKYSQQFEEGVMSFNRGIIPCPYPEISIEAREWNRGWNWAFFENATKIAKAG